MSDALPLVGEGFLYTCRLLIQETRKRIAYVGDSLSLSKIITGANVRL